MPFQLRPFTFLRRPSLSKLFFLPINRDTFSRSVPSNLVISSMLFYFFVCASPNTIYLLTLLLVRLRQ